jgi:hypothetical protein
MSFDSITAIPCWSSVGEALIEACGECEVGVEVRTLPRVSSLLIGLAPAKLRFLVYDPISLCCCQSDGVGKV